MSVDAGEWIRRGSAAWPAVQLGPDREAFVKHVQRHAAQSDGADLRPRIEDLYLAFACARGIPTAIREFATTYRDVFDNALQSWRGLGIDPDDFRQVLHEQLMVGQEAKLLTYAGRGPLRAWLKMVATRWLVDRSRARRARRPSMGDQVLLARMMSAAPDPGGHLLQRRYRAAVAESARVGLAALTPAQRLVLRQRFVFGLSLAELATLHGVHRVTISKRLARARGAALDAVRVDLNARIDAPGEVESLARLCLSQLDLSVGRLLQSSAS